jgi:hypothetical protein
MSVIYNVDQYNQSKSISAKIGVLCPCCTNWFETTRLLLQRALKSNRLKFCSIKCANKFQSEKIQLECVFCKQQIERVASQLKNVKHVFCNHSCAAQFNNSLRPKKLKQPKKAKPVAKVVEHICINCGKISIVSARASLKKKFCSGSCRNVINNKTIRGTRSKVEKEFELAIKANFPDLKFNCNDRQILDGLELDFYFPEINLAIEFNGIWHLKPIRGEELLVKYKQRDKHKKRLCEEKNIKLLVLCDEASSNKSIDEQVHKAIAFLKQFQHASEATVDGPLPLKENICVVATTT